MNKKDKNKGFVLLFAVTLAAIFLSIALGLSSIALKEINFGTSVKDTDNAFYAADIGTQCALMYDGSNSVSDPTHDAFDGGSHTITCASNSISISPASTWTFYVSGLNTDQKGCAAVTVDKVLADLTLYQTQHSLANPPSSLIVSDGYNKGTNGGGTCITTQANTIEREIDTPTF